MRGASHKMKIKNILKSLLKGFLLAVQAVMLFVVIGSALLIVLALWRGDPPNPVDLKALANAGFAFWMNEKLWLRKLT